MLQAIGKRVLQFIQLVNFFYNHVYPINQSVQEMDVLFDLAEAFDQCSIVAVVGTI